MKLYSRLDDHKTYAEFWGSSTKHPDCIECLQNDLDNGNFHLFFDNTVSIADLLQWLMYIASKKTWIFHAIELLDDIQNMYADLKEIKTPFYE